MCMRACVRVRVCVCCIFNYASDLAGKLQQKYSSFDTFTSENSQFSLGNTNCSWGDTELVSCEPLVITVSLIDQFITLCVSVYRHII